MAGAPEGSHRLGCALAQLREIYRPVARPGAGDAGVKPGRNDPCTCGSGRKYKRCCGQDGANRAAGDSAAIPAMPAMPAMAALVTLAKAGRHGELERRAEALLTEQPNCGPLWRMLGLSQWMQGKDALHALQRTAQLLPTDAEAHGNLGTALRARGQFGEAVKCYRRALEIEPGFVEAHNNLGSALRDLEQLTDAVASYRRALALKPDLAVAHCNLGNALRVLRQIEEAVRCYRRALEIEPQFAEAHTGLGNALQELGQFDAAAASYRHALTLCPDAAEFHDHLGSALLALGRLDEAEASCRRAVALDLKFAQAHTNLGMVLRLQGRAAQAEASCRRALEIDPALAGAMVFLSQLHADKGEFVEAEQCLRRAIAIEPECADAWAAIPGMRRMTRGDADWLAAAQRLAAQPQPPRREAALYYALGKYFDDVGDFEQAFASYRHANELPKRHGAWHDRQAVVREFDRIIEFNDQEWIGRVRGGANSSPRAVFIVGMPRSGTTLAEQILASHPAVFGAGELSSWITASARYISA